MRKIYALISSLGHKNGISILKLKSYVLTHTIFKRLTAKKLCFDFISWSQKMVYLLKLKSLNLYRKQYESYPHENKSS